MYSGAAGMEDNCEKGKSSDEQAESPSSDGEVAERRKHVASQFKTRASGNRMKWELPKPIASSSPVVTRWQHLSGRKFSTDVVTGAPLMTVIEAGEKTWTETPSTVKSKELTPSRNNEHLAGVKVITMRQTEQETLLVAEGGKGSGRECETESVTFAGNVVRTITGTETNRRPGMEAATDTDMVTRVEPPASRNVNFQLVSPRHSWTSDTANRKRASTKALGDYLFPNHKQLHRNTGHHFLNNLKERHFVIKQRFQRVMPSDQNKTRIVTINGKYNQTGKVHKNNLSDVSLHVKQDGTISKRSISLNPMKVLDAPGMKDDYSTTIGEYMQHLGEHFLHSLQSIHILPVMRPEKHDSPIFIFSTLTNEGTSSVPDVAREATLLKCASQNQPAAQRPSMPPHLPLRPLHVGVPDGAIVPVTTSFFPDSDGAASGSASDDCSMCPEHLDQPLLAENYSDITSGSRHDVTSGRRHDVTATGHDDITSLSATNMTGEGGQPCSGPPCATAILGQAVADTEGPRR
ncbi:uncharacterized protein [Narcine bancroftii]|uniref:uncharacterized protein n=1 Tax=Narcine bancroftii TaxID=1343680 RepID=UPI00383209F7